MKNNIKKAPVKFWEDLLYFQHFMHFCFCSKLVIITTLNLMSLVSKIEHFLFNCDKYVCNDVFKWVHAENYHKFQACIDNREYARGRRERRNHFRPADVAFFSSESDKNVALIFRKIRCFNIHFSIHTCHRLVFDLGRSSTRYASGFHKKSIRARGPVWEGS